MKCLLLALGLAVVPLAFSQDSSTNELTRTEVKFMTRLLEAEQSAMGVDLPLKIFAQDPVGQYKPVPVRIMEPLKSEALRELSPSLKAYRLIASVDLVHHRDYSSLLLTTNGLPYHLESDNDVASFLGALSRKVKSKDEALRVVRAFADLRSYRIVERPPEFPDVRSPTKRPAPAPTDYKFLAEEEDEQWRVYATFLTSDLCGCYHRFVFTLHKPPGAGVRFSQPALIRQKYDPL
jgi:hypothetical protein